MLLVCCRLVVDCFVSHRFVVSCLFVCCWFVVGLLFGVVFEVGFVLVCCCCCVVRFLFGGVDLIIVLCRCVVGVFVGLICLSVIGLL